MPLLQCKIYVLVSFCPLGHELVHGVWLSVYSTSLFGVKHRVLKRKEKILGNKKGAPQEIGTRVLTP